MGPILAFILLFSFFILLWYIIQLLIKKKSSKFASIAITAICGVLILFLVVYSQIKAAEAEKQAVLAVAAQVLVQKNAEEAQKQTALALESLAESRRQTLIAEKARAELEICKTSK